jgi:hypothetical protein
MPIDRKYLIFALAYAATGMGPGIWMAASGNHGQFVTHAHVMLVGFVVSLLYAVVYKLWLPGPAVGLARLQFYIHQFGAVLMMIGLYLLYGGLVPESRMEPILGVASVAVLLGVLLMLWLVMQQSRDGDSVALRRA